MLRVAAMLLIYIPFPLFSSRVGGLTKQSTDEIRDRGQSYFRAARSFTILLLSAGDQQLHAASPKQTFFFPRSRVTQFQDNAPNNEVMSTSRTTSNLHDEHGRGEKVKNSEGTTCPGAKEAKATDYIGQRGKHERGPTQGRQ